ncbi:MAG: FAD-binding oxidoreductase, partial [Pseudomonadota bacterium]
MLRPATDSLLNALRTALPEAAFRAPDPRYFEEPRGRWQGRAAAVLAPGSPDEASTIMRLANDARVPVVPFSGGTGLVGGQIAPDGPAPLLISTERLKSIRATHAQENILIAEAGATLAEIQSAASDAGRLFPLSYASEGTARIGGALAVNSGGLAVLRYGTARDLCLGLEAVLPNGAVWNGLTRLRKDNTGYSLRDLLIGAEGTLGLITAAALRLFPAPTARATALLTVTSPETALALFARAGAVLGETVSAFELISGMGFGFLAETGLGPARPFDPAPPWMVLIEAAASHGAPEAALEALFTAALEAGEVVDGVLAHSEAQRADLWALRETIPAANARIGAIASHDIALPLSEIPGFLEETGASLARLAPALRINAFGHLGDGNLHYNLFPPAGAPREAHLALRDDATRLIHDAVDARGGSFSAEHGVGRLKVGELERYGDPTKLAAMRAIKAALDPN